MRSSNSSLCVSTPKTTLPEPILPHWQIWQVLESVWQYDWCWVWGRLTGHVWTTEWCLFVHSIFQPDPLCGQTDEPPTIHWSLSFSRGGNLGLSCSATQTLQTWTWDNFPPRATQTVTGQAHRECHPFPGSSLAQHLWVALSCSELHLSLWVALSHSELLWVTLSCSESLWVALSHLCPWRKFHQVPKLNPSTLLCSLLCSSPHNCCAQSTW